MIKLALNWEKTEKSHFLLKSNLSVILVSFLCHILVGNYEILLILASIIIFFRFPHHESPPEFPVTSSHHRHLLPGLLYHLDPPSPNLAYTQKIQSCSSFLKAFDHIPVACRPPSHEDLPSASYTPGTARKLQVKWAPSYAPVGPRSGPSIVPHLWVTFKFFSLLMWTASCSVNSPFCLWLLCLCLEHLSYLSRF